MALMQPSGLWALAAVVPIVVAYLLRMPRLRLAVPHAAPWLRLTANDRRISNERRTMISLALQLAVTLGIAGALARPYLAAGGEGRHHIVVVDCSRSMRACDATPFAVIDADQHASTSGATRMRRAHARISALIAGMGPDDRMTLIAAGARPQILASGERLPATLDRALARAEAHDEVADLAGACALAVELAKAAERPHVAVVSDGSFAADQLEPLAKLRPEAGKADYIRVGKACDNLGVVRMKARRSAASQTDAETIVTVANSGTEARAVPVVLWLDARVLGEQELEVPADGEATAVFHTPYRVGGVLTARLRVSDALPDDDQAIDWLPAPRRMEVALVRKDALDEKALQEHYLATILRCDTGIAPGFLPSEQYLAVTKDPKALKQIEAAVFENWAPEREDELPPCHCLFINCESAALPVALKRVLEDKPLIRRWDAGHPLMTHLNLRNVFLTKAKEVALSSPDEDAVVDLVGSPLVVAREVGGRKLAYIAFDPQDSDIRFKKELPLLIFNVFQWFKRGPEPTTQVAPGEPIRLPISDPTWRSITVLPPGGGAQDSVPVAEGAGEATVVRTAVPGVYRWLGEGERSPQRGFAVVFQDARESRLGVLESATVGERDAKGAIADNRVACEDASGISTLGGGGSQWWPFLAWTALAVLLAEAWLYHRRIFF